MECVDKLQTCKMMNLYYEHNVQHVLLTLIYFFNIAMLKY